MSIKSLSLFIAIMTSVFSASFAGCPKEIQEARLLTADPIVVVLFDGLGTNEFGTKLLQRKVGEKISKRCSTEKISFVNFHYGSKGIEKAYKCLSDFKSTFGSNTSFHLIGHSFGAGIGVINLLKRSTKTDFFQNVITFDPRGGTYKYKSPGKIKVRQFINIYQRIPLAGRPVADSQFEFDATGQSGHLHLPAKFGDLALSKLIGRLSCARN